MLSTAAVIAIALVANQLPTPLKIYHNEEVVGCARKFRTDEAVTKGIRLDASVQPFILLPSLYFFNNLHVVPFVVLRQLLCVELVHEERN